MTEEGFEVSVVSDATAGGLVDGLGDGHKAALINFRFIANAVADTDSMLSAMGSADPSSVVFPEPGNEANETDGGRRQRSLSTPRPLLTNNILQDLEKKSGDRKLQDAPSFDPTTTAVVIIDPQNDFLSPNGVTWGYVCAPFLCSVYTLLLSYLR